MASNQLRSMTGFATMSGQSGALNWAWELRSVNGRGFDIRFRLPGQCETLETSLRHAISRVCSRGRVSVSLNIGHDHRDAGILFDRLELDAVLDATRMIADAARERGISLTPDSPSGILASAIATRGSGERESDLSELTPILEREIVKVVESWDESRLSEGRLIIWIARWDRSLPWWRMRRKPSPGVNPVLRTGFGTTLPNSSTRKVTWMKGELPWNWLSSRSDRMFPKKSTECAHMLCQPANCLKPAVSSGAGSTSWLRN